MRVLFDIGHPAHIHYFKNCASILLQKNNKILFTLRDKEITKFLIEKYGFDYKIIGKNGKSFLQKIKFSKNTVKNLLFVCKSFKPDLLISFYSPYSAIVSKIINVPSIGFADSDEAKLSILMAKFTTDYSFTPKYFSVNLGKNHYKFDSFMELAYLHPDIFSPNVSVINKIGLTNAQKITLIRLVSWNAVHDIGIKGLKLFEILKIIDIASKYSKVFISSESECHKDLENYLLNISPELFHDLLYFTDLYIGEGATTASECCMLGVPAIYINKLNAGTLKEQEKHGLLFNFRSFSENVLSKIENILSDDNFKKELFKKRQQMLGSKINLTNFMVWLIQNFPDSIEILKSNPDFQYNFL